MGNPIRFCTRCGDKHLWLKCPLYKRKPPYQQGYEDGVADRRGDTPDMRSIYDHEDYNDDESSRDRLHYEEGYLDGFEGFENKLTKEVA